MKKKDGFEERVVLGEDFRPNYMLKSDRIRITEEEIPLNHPPELLKKWAEEERNTLIKRAKVLNEKPEFFNNFQRVDIDLIYNDFGPWNLFDLPTKAERIDLMQYRQCRFNSPYICCQSMFISDCARSTFNFSTFLHS